MCLYIVWCGSTHTLVHFGAHVGALMYACTYPQPGHSCTHAGYINLHLPILMDGLVVKGESRMKGRGLDLVD